MKQHQNNKLKNYWFNSKVNIGAGITAYSIEEAMLILDGAVKRHNLHLEIESIVEDIKFEDLDQNHVVPNMNPMSFRGVWFPMLDENLKNDWT